MIEQIVPAGVAYAEASCDLPDTALFPEEEALVARARAGRRGEFATARDCARRALAGLGVPPAPILAGERGAPRWPAGVVGSITHCEGYRAAVVARDRDLRAIGVDAEPDDMLPARVLRAIALPAERERLRELETAAPHASWDRLLFSAKEAAYKAWFPLAGRWLGFHDADITINAADGTFGVRLLIDGPLLDEPGAGDSGAAGRLTGFTGRWLVRNGLILTAIAVPGSHPHQ